MTKLSGLPVFALVVLFVALLMPATARAQTANTNPCTQGNAIDQGILSSLGTAGQNEITARQSIILTYGAKTIGQCLDKIYQLINTIGTGQNPVVAIIINALWTQIMGVINQACNAALDVTKQLTNYATRELQSLTCIPMPKLGLTIDKINLGLPTPPPCNGVSLLSPGAPGPRIMFSYPNMIPMAVPGPGGPYLP